MGLFESEVGWVASFNVQLLVTLFGLLLLFVLFQYSMKALPIHDRSLVHDILLLGLLNVSRCRLDLWYFLILTRILLLSLGTFGRLLEDLLPILG